MIVALAALALAGSATSAPAFVDRQCSDPALVGVARCGTVDVPEDRSGTGSRQIALNVVVLPAISEAPTLPPLIDIDGGPGQPSTRNAGFYLTDGTAYRDHRAIVLVDQRGTGGSNPLHCPEFSKPEAQFAPMFDPKAVQRCRTELERKADLRLYGTDSAAHDLDDVRAALGFERVDLSGTSYGTTVALRYMTLYPKRVRAALLMGVNPPEAMPPRSHAPAADRALGLLFDRCREDIACAAMGDPDTNLAAAIEKLSGDPSAPSRDVFMEKIRTLMYAPPTARIVPSILARAADGDLALFFEATSSRSTSTNADGMFLSVICSESMGPMDVDAARAASRKTRFGDYRLRTQAAACAIWPSARIDRASLAFENSDAAVLIVSGEIDPVTPPAWGDDVAARLGKARNIVIPGSGHIFDGMTGVDTCLDPLIVEFLDGGDVSAIDASCIETMRAPPFADAD